MDKNNLKLRNRFVDDFNLPVSVLDSPYFEYQLELYNPYNSANTKWESLISLIDENYGGNENLFLEDYYHCRNKIITSIEESDSYKEFISSSMDRYTIPSNSKFHTTGKSSVYNAESHGKHFLSIDLKQANYHALKYHNPELVNNTDNYEDFIKYHLGYNHPLITYFSESKYTRQIIFGKLNMSRNVTIQNYLIYKIYNFLSKHDEKGVKIHSRQADELILEIEDLNTLQKTYLLGYIEIVDIPVKTQFYRLEKHNFETSSGKIFSVYLKYDRLLLLLFLEEIKCCPIAYFPQVYKLLTDQEISKNDLVFYYEKNLCNFLYPIKNCKFN